MIHGQEQKTVLVVDDAAANIRVVNEILHDRYHVRIATSGAKGIELATGAPQPDLILLDVIMPGMDGYEVCSRLKANADTRNIPVIFLTGHDETGELPQSVAAKTAGKKLNCFQDTKGLNV